MKFLPVFCAYLAFLSFQGFAKGGHSGAIARSHLPSHPLSERSSGVSAAKAAKAPSFKAPVATPREHRSTYAPGVARDSAGKIKRSETAKRDFMRQTGHPNGWPGHVVDHVVPLKRGGADTPANMQWQTIEQAKAKDKVE